MFVFVGSAIYMTGVLLTAFYIFSKSINYKLSSTLKILSVLWSLLWSLLFAYNPAWFPQFFIRPIACVASIFFLLSLTRLNISIVISAYLMSYGISYVLYFMALFPINLVFMPFASDGYIEGSALYYNTPMFLLRYSVASAIQLVLAYLLFRIRRFKKGFPFLLNGYTIIISLIAAGSVLVLTTWGRIIVGSNDVFTINFILIGILIIGVGIFIWVKRGIKAAYIRWAKDNNTTLYEQKMAEKDREIQHITELNKILQAENHSINHRLAALERGYLAMLEEVQCGTFSMDIANELCISLEDVRRAARDYQEGVGQTKREINLPSTKIKMLDDLFGLFAERCVTAKIDFNIILNGSIPYMIENVVSQSELETMIGDHLQNAIIAVNASDNPFRGITVTLGLMDNYYALTVFDSGIPFALDTLVQLGLERVTTHADTGGSGVGFMKTFETLREHDASLIIDEKESGIEGYTKSVTIRFDGKKQYIISTYRPGEFPVNDRYEVIGT